MKETFENFGGYLGFISGDLERQREEFMGRIENLKASTRTDLSFEVVREYMLGASHGLDGPNQEGRPYFHRKESFLGGICALEIYVGGPYSEKTENPDAYSVDLLLSHPLLRENPQHLLASYRGQGPMALFNALKRKEENRQALPS